MPNIGTTQFYNVTNQSFIATTTNANDDASGLDLQPFRYKEIVTGAVSSTTADAWEFYGAQKESKYVVITYVKDKAGNIATSTENLVRTTANIVGTGKCSDGIDNDGDGLIDWQYDKGCIGPDDDELSEQREMKEGWTTYDPASSTRIVYVSSSSGNDSNDGLSPNSPKKTISSAVSLIRDNSSDWLLLKRGDTWVGEKFGNWYKSGISPENPILISSYGQSAERPIIQSNYFDRSIAIWGSVKNLSIIGLNIIQTTKDPSREEFTSLGWGEIAMFLTDGASDIIVEDNKLEYTGLIVQDQKFGQDIRTRSNIGKIEIRRNIIANNYSINSHSQGIYTETSGPLLVEENVLHHNGWNDDFNYVLTGPNSDYTQWSNITSGKFNIVINNITYSIDNVDFTSVQNMDDVAVVLENSINNVVGVGVVDFDWMSVGKVLKMKSVYGSNPTYAIKTYTGADSSGTDISSAAWLNSIRNAGLPVSTIFNRNMYLKNGFSNTKVIGNIDSNGASGGIQLRMGGLIENNLYLNNPVSIAVGHVENTGGVDINANVKNNVILGARDIDGQPQGVGITFGSIKKVKDNTGTSRIVGLNVEGNIILKSGPLATAATGITGLNFGGDDILRDVSVTNNVVYDWTRTSWPSVNDHRAYALEITTNNHVNFSMSDNYFIQPNSGFSASLKNNSSPTTTGVVFDSNTYYSAESNPPTHWPKGWFRTDVRNSVSSSTWFALTQENNPILEMPNFYDPTRDIESYLNLIESSNRPNNNYEYFIDKAMQQSKYSWDQKYSANNVNNYIRYGFGINPQNKNHSVNIISEQNGSVTPSGNVRVVNGGDVTLKISPNQGYVADQITINGVSESVSTRFYLIKGINRDVTISVNFKLISTNNGTSTNDGGTTVVDISKRKSSSGSSRKIVNKVPDNTQNIIEQDTNTNTNNNNTQKTNSSFNRYLQVGMTGNDVLLLQKFLNNSNFIIAAQGPGSIGNETNYFGVATRNALINFQKENGISPATGYFGPRTMSYINNKIDKLGEVVDSSNYTTTPQLEISTSTIDIIATTTKSNDKIFDFNFKNNLSLGVQAEDVVFLQKILNINSETLITDSGEGSKGNETNYFGKLTQDAVKRFQLKYKIVSEQDSGFGIVGPKTRVILNNLINKGI